MKSKEQQNFSQGEEKLTTHSYVIHILSYSGKKEFITGRLQITGLDHNDCIVLFASGTKREENCSSHGITIIPVITGFPELWPQDHTCADAGC